jgi:catechol 2,3-dioxygenase-like lactoylglutathione lyase family enzyme
VTLPSFGDATSGPGGVASDQFQRAGVECAVIGEQRVRLNHVTLRVSDLDRSVAFYKRLGLTQIVAGPAYARFSCPEGDGTLSLECDGEPVDESASSISVHFESDELDAVVAELEGRGFVFEQAPTDQPYLWREAILRDLDGHRLFLYRAGGNRLDPPWRLQSGAGGGAPGDANEDGPVEPGQQEGA